MQFFSIMCAKVTIFPGLTFVHGVTRVLCYSDLGWVSPETCWEQGRAVLWKVGESMVIVQHTPSRAV